jgi:Spy/CpxP family protein refolding chaperone
MSQVNLMKLLKTGAVVSVLALSGLTAMAQGHGGMRGGQGGPEMMMGGRIEQVLEAVDATDAQRAQIKQIMQAARVDMKAQHQAGNKLRQQGLALFAATNIDAAAIEALRVQMQAQHEAVSKRMSVVMVEVARVLTPEQRAKFAERMKKRQARMAEHMQARPAKSAN